MSNQKIVLASGNLGKAQEFSDILGKLGIDIVLQKEFNVPDCVEDGLSFVENAIKKARNAAKYSNLPALADDSGLCVDYLKGAPGIYSARFSAPNPTDSKNNAKLLELLKDVPMNQRQASYWCALAYVRSADDPLPLISIGSWQGYIGFSEKGSNGFGYDPLFLVTNRDCTAAQLPPQLKNVMSHRARAILGIYEQLEKELHPKKIVC